MALDAGKIALLESTAEFLRTQQTTVAVPLGISLDTITSSFPEDEAGVVRSEVRFIWDQDMGRYRIQIPT